MNRDGLARIALETMDKYSMLETGDGVVVGVSGGPDSVALLHFLRSIAPRYSLKLHIAHVHHMIRGADADGDALFVEELARSFGIPCTVEKVDVPQLARELGITVEDAGRDARYGLYRRICLERGFARAAVAHHADDQAETVLMRILRGTGLRGLAGIPPLRELGDEVMVIRPLIEVSRAQVEEYCIQHGLATRADPTNVDTQYFRNRVRCELLPLLERDYNSHIRAGLVRLARLAAQDEHYLERQARELLDAAVTAAGALGPGAGPSRAAAADAARRTHAHQGRVELDRETMRRAAAPVASRAFALAFEIAAGERRDLYQTHLDALVALTDGGSVGDSIDLPKGVQARLTYDTIVTELVESADRGRAMVGPMPCGPDDADTQVFVPGVNPVGWAQVTIFAAVGRGPAGNGESEAEDARSPSLAKLACMANRALADCGFGGLCVVASGIGREWAVFDADRVDLDALVIRPWREGDRISLFGMAGSKKLSDLFVDEKVPRSRRARLAVLASGAGDGDEALWVVGVRASGRGAVTLSTRRLVVLAANADDFADDV